MNLFDWSDEKNLKLKQERGVSFEEVVFAIESGGLIDVIPHPNQRKYSNQSIYVVNIDNYIYLVPFVREETGKRFLKTIIPSHKAYRQYIKEVKK